MSNYVSLYARKPKYGGKGWAFDCDSGGNITDPKMIDGRIDMMNQCLCKLLCTPARFCMENIQVLPPEMLPQ